jgi:GNAT superfamily N-acetyltransferase
MQAVASSRAFPREIEVGGESIRLRLMNEKDKDPMLAFAQSLDEEDVLFLRMDITKPDVVQRWIDSVLAGQRMTVLAEQGGEIVAYGSLNRTGLSWSRHMGEIRIIVRRNFRRTGLGAVLAEEVFTFARDMGLTRIVSQMPTDQPGGRRMFEGLGFKPEALLTDWVIDRRGKTHDLLIMSHDVTG